MILAAILLGITLYTFLSYHCSSFHPLVSVQPRSASRKYRLLASMTTGSLVENTLRDDSDEVDDDDTLALSCFGTKEYWDDVYTGRGDFPASEYSWYYDWSVIKRHTLPFMMSKEASIFLPGIGNDSLLIDLVKAGYRKLSAQDYCASAIERQRDLLDTVDFSEDDVSINLSVSDIRQPPICIEETYDVIIEKGLLDAVYLSGGGNVEQAVSSLTQRLAAGGIFISISGVVSSEVRANLFNGWEWLRDGDTDLQAGCFIFRKP